MLSGKGKERGKIIVSILFYRLKDIRNTQRGYIVGQWKVVGEERVTDEFYKDPSQRNSQEQPPLSCLCLAMEKPQRCCPRLDRSPRTS